VQEMTAKAMARKLTWGEAAEIMGVTDRTMRRWRARTEKRGDTSLYDRRRHARGPSPGFLWVAAFFRLIEESLAE
jgi:hypothetical protein